MNLIEQSTLPVSHQLLEHLPVAIYICDTKGKINYFNPAAAGLWGRKPKIGEELWCGSWRIFAVDGSELPLDECPMALTLKEGRPVLGEEIIIERPDGQRLNILPHPHPIFNEDGALQGAINMLVDITKLRVTRSAIDRLSEQFDFPAKTMDDLESETEIKTKQLNQAIERLRRNEQLYHRMIVEVQDYAILSIDKDGFIENWNKGAEKIKGYTAEEIIGKNMEVFYTAEDKRNELPRKLLHEARTNGRTIHEGWRVRKDGSKFWCSVVITALHDKADNIFGFSKVTRDLTDIKKNEDQLRLSRDQLNLKNKELAMMNEELSSFAYIASHDLQEPLRKIQTFGSKLRDLEHNQLSERGKEYIERMESAAVRMQALIQDLLTYSSTNTVDAKIELVDLNNVLEEVKKELEETINEKGIVFHSEKLPIVSGIPFQMQQLVQNIIHNAIKFSRKEVIPEIFIRVAQVAAPRVLDADPSKLFHRISFIDNGIGFEQEYSFKIMEVFQRLHGKAEYSGTGIGLAICKRIAENHGGTIVAEGKVNEGATFHVYLPVKTL